MHPCLECTLCWDALKICIKKKNAPQIHSTLKAARDLLITITKSNTFSRTAELH